MRLPKILIIGAGILIISGVAITQGNSTVRASPESYSYVAVTFTPFGNNKIATINNVPVDSINNWWFNMTKIFTINGIPLH
jgi:hypothetical protein